MIIQDRPYLQTERRLVERASLVGALRQRELRQGPQMASCVENILTLDLGISFGTQA